MEMVFGSLLTVELHGLKFLVELLVLHLFNLLQI